jgi:Leucine-rich repeat (LRR) protein/serine/threonine protein kinase
VSLIPSTSEQFVDLSKRDLRGPLSSSVLAQLQSATRLRRLWLSENQLERAAVHDCMATTLEELYLHHNALRSIDGDAASWLRLGALTTLWLDKNKLRSLPDALPVSLLDVRLGDNRFDAVPAAVLLLTRLLTLDLSSNALSSLPAEIGLLTALTSLGVADNDLALLPESIVLLTRLVELDADFNRLVDLPRAFGEQLPLLRSLNLAENQLHSAPISAVDWRSLTSLRAVDLSNNRLTRLPDALLALTALADLRINDNSLFAMPPAVVNLTNLTRLDALGNPWLNVTEALLEKRGKALVRHFAPGTVKPRRRVRVLVLGDAGSGRSTLIGSLMASNKRARASLAVDHMSSSLRILRFETPAKSVVTLWDFSRDSHYDMSHRLFVEPDTVIMVVFDLSQPLRLPRLRHWLSAARDSNASMLVFGTHSDLLTPAEIRTRLAAVEAELSQRVSRSLHVLGDVDARSPESAEALFDAMAKVIDESQAALRPVPVAYRKLEDVVLDHAAPVLTRDELARLCAAQSLVGDDDVNGAVEFLHSVGALYSNGAVREMRDVFVRDPKLLVHALSSLVAGARKSALVHNGVVRHMDLFLLWHDVSVDLFTPLLALFEHYQLCFRLHDRLDIDESFRDGQSLFPLLLDDEKDVDVPSAPAAPRSASASMIYARVFEVRRAGGTDRVQLSSDVFPSFLVRVLRHTSRAWVVRYSKTSAYLALGANEAYCRLDALSTRLVVEVRGPSPVRLLGTLVEIAELCLGDVDTQQHCELLVRVPCAHCRSRGLKPPALLDVAMMEAALRNGELAVRCHATRRGAEQHEPVQLAFWSPAAPTGAPPVPPLSRQRSDVAPEIQQQRRTSQPVLTESVSMVNLLLPGAAGIGASEGVSAARVPIASLVPDLALVNVPTVRFEALALGAQLGRGLMTTVFKATLDGATVAVKRFDLNSSDQSTYEELKAFRRECALLSELTHPNLIQLKALCLSPPCMVLSFEDRGDLYSFLIDKTNAVSQRLALELACDVSSALAFLHAQAPPVLHLDFKSPNVLLRSGARRVEARLSDLGVSRVQSWGALKRRIIDNPRWLANEVLDNSIGYTVASDNYSLGVVLWELYARQEPFSEFTFKFDSQLEDRIVKGLRPTIAPATPPGVRDLICALWSPLARSRPTAAAAVEALNKLLGDSRDDDAPVVVQSVRATPLVMARLAVPPLMLDAISGATAAAADMRRDIETPPLPPDLNSDTTSRRRRRRTKHRKENNSKNAEQ